MNDLNNIDPNGQSIDNEEPVVENDTTETIETSSPDNGQEGEPIDESVDEVKDWEAEYNKVNGNYSELRSKFDSNNNDHKSKIEELYAELGAFQQYHKDTNKLIEALQGDPELLATVQGLVPDETVSKKDIEDMINSSYKEQAALREAEEKEEKEFDKVINDFSKKYEDTPEEIMNKIQKSIEEEDLKGTTPAKFKKLLEGTYATHMLSHQKALGTKEEQLRIKKLNEASGIQSGGPTNNKTVQAKSNNLFSKGATEGFNNFFS